MFLAMPLERAINGPCRWDSATPWTEDPLLDPFLATVSLARRLVWFRDSDRHMTIMSKHYFRHLEAKSKADSRMTNAV
jgi:hypothetical protein